jgi:hypothetical protein
MGVNIMQQFSRIALLLGGLGCFALPATAKLNIGGSRGLLLKETTCTGYCEPENIDCSHELKQGSYLWCQQNCTAADIPNREEYLKALKKCERKKQRKHLPQEKTEIVID